MTKKEILEEFNEWWGDKDERWNGVLNIKKFSKEVWLEATKGFVEEEIKGKDKMTKKEILDYIKSMKVIQEALLRVEKSNLNIRFLEGYLCALDTILKVNGVDDGK